MNILNWFKKEKPKVFVTATGIIVFDESEVEIVHDKDVHSVKSGISSKAFIGKSLLEELADVGNTFGKSMEFMIPAKAHKEEPVQEEPETVESMLNKFIEAGYDKPVVRIEGHTMHGGSGRFDLFIDNDLFGRNYPSVEMAEKDALRCITYRFEQLPLENITVTY